MSTPWLITWLYLKIEQLLYQRKTHFIIQYTHFLFSNLETLYGHTDLCSSLPKMYCLDVLKIFSVDMGQNSFSLLKTALATWQQHTFLSTSITFYNVFAWACAKLSLELDEKVTYTFRLISFFLVFLLFLSFCFSNDWPCSGLASSLKFLRKHHWDRQFTMG